jgi:hypothetical protein
MGAKPRAKAGSSIGATALAFAQDIEHLQRVNYAYGRLVLAIDELKKRDPFKGLELELVAILQRKPAVPD